MQKQLIANTQTGNAATLPQTAESRTLKLRIAVPALPARQCRLADRAVRAALRAAELAFWQTTGGDFLRRSRSA